MNVVETCEICGRGYSEDEGHLTGERGAAACYRLGYEREKARADDLAEQITSIATEADEWRDLYEDAQDRAEALVLALRAYQSANRIHNDAESDLYGQGEAALAKAEGRSAPQ